MSATAVMVTCRQDLADVLLQAVSVVAAGITFFTALLSTVSLLAREPPDRLAQRINTAVAVGSIVSALPAFAVLVVGLASDL
jgi:hypothetical protein